MFALIEEQIKEQIAAQSIPGFSMAVVKGQEVIYANGFGVTNKEEGGVPVTANTLFRIGSLSKPLTATAIMILVEQGNLDIDIPIKEYIPQFKMRDQQAADKITLRMLLNHSAGLQDGTDIIGSQLGCGLTFITENYNGLSTIRHGGAIGTYTCFMLGVPDKELAVVTMSSQDFGIDLAYEVMDKLLDVKPTKDQPKMITPNKLNWDLYNGYYLGNLSGLAHIFIDHQKLKIQLNRTEMTLHAFEEDLYFAKDSERNPVVTVGFVFDEEEQVNYVVVNGQACKRVSQEFVSLPMVDLLAIEGKYCNGAVSYGLKVIENQLFLLDEDEKLLCTPLYGGLFFTEEHGLIEIKEIENKSILVIQDNWKFEKVNN